jgi:hypothetical protein
MNANEYNELSHRLEGFTHWASTLLTNLSSLTNALGSLFAGYTGRVTMALPGRNLYFLLNNIVLNIDVIDSITFFIVIGVLNC